jgi:hypothetical protein
MSEEEIEEGVITRSIFDFKKKTNSVSCLESEEKPPGSPVVAIKVGSRRGSRIGSKPGSRVSSRSGSRKGSRAGSRRNSQDEEEIIDNSDSNVALELIEHLIKENEQSKRRSVGK